MSYKNSERTTIRLTSNRSLHDLSTCIDKINDNLYDSVLYNDDRIVLRTIYSIDETISHFEIEGSPIDFFHLGMRLGALEEKRHQDWRVGIVGSLQK